MVRAGASFPSEKLHLIPDTRIFIDQIYPNRRLNRNLAGFDEFSFAQIGYGTGGFSTLS
jgi:hypothetical protein